MLTSEHFNWNDYIMKFENGNFKTLYSCFYRPYQNNVLRFTSNNISKYFDIQAY